MYIPQRNDVVTLVDQDGNPSIRFPGRWRIEKVNPKTIRVLPLDGQDVFGVKASHALVKPVSREAAKDVPAPASRTPFRQGTIVEWTKRPSRATGRYYVVIRDTGSARVGRIVKLGGETDCDYDYWKNVPAADLTAVDPGRITIR